MTTGTIFHEYDAQGWYVGWHQDPARPNSTPVDPSGIRAQRARWGGSAWADDGTRETQAAADDATTNTQRQQAVAVCRAYTPATATAADVRATLGAALVLLRDVLRDLKP